MTRSGPLSPPSCNWRLRRRCKASRAQTWTTSVAGPGFRVTAAQYDLNPALPYLTPQSGATRLKERRHEVAVVPGRQPRYSTDHGLGMKISS